MVVTGTIFTPGLSPNTANDNWKNFLDTYSGYVEAAFQRSTVTENLPIIRRQQFPRNAKSDQFIVTGRRTGQYIARGNSVLLDTTSAAAGYLEHLAETGVHVYLDRPLGTPFLYDDIDAYMEHWGAQQQHQKAGGEFIARRRDLLNLLLIARAAFKTDAGSGENKTWLSGTKEVTTYLEATVGGVNMANFASNGTPNATTTLNALDLMRTRFDQNHVPEDGRYCFVQPADYNWMVSNLQEYIQQDTNPGNGSMSTGKVNMINGWRIIKTTNWPTSGANANPTDYSGSGSAGSANQYKHNATNLFALFAGEEVIGRESMGSSGFETKMSYETDRLAWLILPYWTGGAVDLRPEACGAIAGTAVATRNS